jgi:hypothetical protein
MGCWIGIATPRDPNHTEAKVLDGRRLATWEEKERLGAYLSRISGVYLIWDLELGTNDCRGWIRRSLFKKLELPEGHFYQFRLAFGEPKGIDC